VIEMRGRTPAWRPMAPGISGPDVTELQANLIRLGYASGLFSAPTGYYDALTAEAVQRWQPPAHPFVTGQAGPGQVHFLPTRAQGRRIERRSRTGRISRAGAVRCDVDQADRLGARQPVIAAGQCRRPGVDRAALPGADARKSNRDRAACGRPGIGRNRTWERV